MGSLAVLGIIAALVVWFIMKNKRSKVAPSSAFINNNYLPQATYAKYEPSPPSPGPFASQMKYDASNPSTFPSALPDPSFGVTSPYPQTTHDPYAQRRGQYSGAPEV